MFTSGSPGIGFYDDRKSCTSMLQLVCTFSNVIAVICPALLRLSSCRINELRVSNFTANAEQ